MYSRMFIQRYLLSAFSQISAYFTGQNCGSLICFLQLNWPIILIDWAKIWSSRIWLVMRGSNHGSTNRQELFQIISLVYSHTCLKSLSEKHQILCNFHDISLELYFFLLDHLIVWSSLSFTGCTKYNIILYSISKLMSLKLCRIINICSYIIIFLQDVEV